jgi:hypothetical protein
MKINRRGSVTRTLQNVVETDACKLTEYGAASNIFSPSKEDERSGALAARARKGDYDDGMHVCLLGYSAC